MRSTRRLLDRSLTAVFAGVYLSVAGVAASCASDRDVLGAEEDAAALDVVADVVSEDAGIDRLPPSRRDAATSDAGPLPVVCASSPCALSLTTTPGEQEGFCALLKDGTVACWGQNPNHQLGRGSDATYSSSAVPERVAGLSNITFLDHTCAVDTDGATWCWGMGPYLRDPTQRLTTEPTPVKLPVPPATMVGLGMHLGRVELGCVVTDDGLVCWGTNRYGQIAVPKLDEAPSTFLPPAPVAIPAGAPIKRLALGEASFIVRSDGTLLSWGANPPLGRVSSLVPDPYPGEPALAGGVVGIDADEDNACAVATGIAHCWGRPVAGTGTAPLDRALPEPIVTPEPLVQIATSGRRAAGGAFRWCGIGVSGAVYCWGDNSFGQVGDGTKDYALEPVIAVGLPAPAAEVKTAWGATCALLTTGRVYCWGRNQAGQLGNGQLFEPSSVPQEVMLP